ncbi:hypothetical protein GALMADRAFT_144186 [Galerina marginata CBS 339.88]|uniref:Uncharacterized protein n=1 Tax=Galerina marginata (strain CBS 339.88) TaxID=685588 RepID=A0A067SJJ3_GALM3|nr:hypothetical protein GALMADRAFT_144186 [Galerina marginata CBS 339.88]
MFLVLSSRVLIVEDTENLQGDVAKQLQASEVEQTAKLTDGGRLLVVWHSTSVLLVFSYQPSPSHPQPPEVSSRLLLPAPMLPALMSPTSSDIIRVGFGMSQTTARSPTQGALTLHSYITDSNWDLLSLAPSLHRVFWCFSSTIWFERIRTATPHLAQLHLLSMPLEFGASVLTVP